MSKARSQRKAIVREETHQRWKSEEIFLTGDSFFESIFAAICAAQKSICFEFYIFAADAIGEKFTAALIEAAQRGVKVRVIVDGIGSAGWEEAFAERVHAAGIEFEVYHLPPWAIGHRIFRSWTPRLPLLQRAKGVLQKRSLSWFRRWREVNHRSHRKLVVVDEEIAFVGSCNITRVHSEMMEGEQAWRDTSVKVTGRAVFDLLLAFEHVWGVKRSGRFRGSIRHGYNYPQLVKLNMFRSVRAKNFRMLCQSITSAKERVWITSSYFVPHPIFLRALIRSRNRGVDVRVLVPGQSDVPFIPWVTIAFYHPLQKAGIPIYEYLPRVLHAKSILVDEHAIVGSSNLNQRSLLHDLEIDVVLNNPATVQTLHDQFLIDIQQARRISQDGQNNVYPWYQRMIGRILLLVKYFL
jgi:cardiolipin synthase